jgi:hypothetical protein
MEQWDERASNPLQWAAIAAVADNLGNIRYPPELREGAVVRRDLMTLLGIFRIDLNPAHPLAGNRDGRDVARARRNAADGFDRQDLDPGPPGRAAGSEPAAHGGRVLAVDHAEDLAGVGVGNGPYPWLHPSPAAMIISNQRTRR